MSAETTLQIILSHLLAKRVGGTGQARKLPPPNSFGLQRQLPNFQKSSELRQDTSAQEAAAILFRGSYPVKELLWMLGSSPA